MNICGECGAASTQLNLVEDLWLCPECRKARGGDGPVDLTTGVIDEIQRLEEFFISRNGQLNPTVLFRGPHAGMNQADMLAGGIRRVVDQVRARSANLRAPVIFFAQRITIGWPEGEKAYFCIHVFHVTNGTLHNIREVVGPPLRLVPVPEALVHWIWRSEPSDDGASSVCSSFAELFQDMFPNGGVLE